MQNIYRHPKTGIYWLRFKARQPKSTGAAQVRAIQRRLLSKLAGSASKSSKPVLISVPDTPRSVDSQPEDVLDAKESRGVTEYHLTQLENLSGSLSCAT